MTIEPHVSSSSFDDDLSRRLSRPGNALARMPTAWRRGLVVLAAVLAVTALALPWLVEGPYQMLSVVPLFAVMLLNVVLNLVTRAVSELPERMLDERVLQAQGRASRRALWTVFLTLDALFLVALVTNPGLLEDGTAATVQMTTVEMTTVQLLSTLAVVTFTGIGLPAWFLAWEQRPEPADDPVPAPPVTEPVGRLPWKRIWLMGGAWGALMSVFTLLSRPEAASSAVVLVAFCLVGGVFFALAIAAYMRWAQRRL
jgi:uncharacterized membrane protein